MGTLWRRVSWWDVFIVRDFAEAIDFGFVCPTSQNETVGTHWFVILKVDACAQVLLPRFSRLRFSDGELADCPVNSESRLDIGSFCAPGGCAYHRAQPAGCFH